VTEGLKRIDKDSREGREVLALAEILAGANRIATLASVSNAAAMFLGRASVLVAPGTISDEAFEEHMQEFIEIARIYRADAQKSVMAGKVS
jgi:ABC-type transporter Mla maintaining outer membrane lipid asymmetry permease subunit MlaE